MADDKPIEVNPSPLPALAQALIRYVAAPLGGYLVGKGWLTADQVPQLAGALLSVGAAAWGLYSTWHAKKRLVTVAEAAPNSVAVVTK